MRTNFSIFEATMSVNQKPVSIAILAGGKNSRFGFKPKALMLWEGEPLISRYLRLLSPLTADLFIITNSPEEYSGVSARMHPDIIPGNGPLSGIHAALQIAQHNYVLITACDMPFLPIKVVNDLMDKYIENPGKVIIPVHSAGKEPLLSLWPVTVKPLLDKWLENKSSLKILDFIDHYNLFQEFEAFADETLFMNINTREDLKSAQKMSDKIPDYNRKR